MLLVDDHREVRDGLRALLGPETTMRVIGEAGNGDEALGLALVLRPDVIVLDQEMPGSSGLDILPKLRVILPEARVVMFTMNTAIAKRARLRGAEAVIAKEDLDGLLAVLRKVAPAREATPTAARQAPPADRRTRWIRLFGVPAVALLYIASFIPLVRTFGPGAADTAILVVAAAGAAYGLRGGLVAAALALPVNALLIDAAAVGVQSAGSFTRAVIAIAIGVSFGRLRDVTLRANAQARSLADTSVSLEVSDRRLLRLVEGAPVLLVAIDTAGVISDALGAGFGDHPKFSADGMRGQQAAVFFADNSEVLARMSRALSGEEFSQRVQAYGFTYDVHVRPRHDQAGALIGTTAVLVKIAGPTPL